MFMKGKEETIELRTGEGDSEEGKYGGYSGPKECNASCFFQNSEVSIGLSRCGVKECSVY